MKHKMLMLALCVAGCFEAGTQATSPPHRKAMNNVFVEALGVTGYYSVNYERVWLRAWDSRLLVTTSVGFSQKTTNGVKWTSFPARLNIAIGKPHFYGEIGFSWLPVWKDYDSDNLASFWEKFWFINLGFRYQPKHKGLFARAYVFPVPVDSDTYDTSPYLYHLGYNYYKLRDEKKFTLWGGIGLGYSF